MLDFKVIETPEQFYKWAETVNHLTKDKFLCDLQDVYARSDVKKLYIFFMESNR